MQMARNEVLVLYDLIKSKYISVDRKLNDRLEKYR